MNFDSIFQSAHAAWRETDPWRKAAAVRALAAQTDRLNRGTFDPTELTDIPGHPTKPALVNPREVPQRSLAAPEGRAVLLHALCHIEFNAINLALDALLRWPEMPETYTRQWLAVAGEEALHFELLSAHLETRYGVRYGDHAAHNGLWEIACKTDYDVLARMALVPRVLEARGLDVTPAIQTKLKQAGDHDAADILAIILRDEVKHVAVGNHWYHTVCEARGLDPIAVFDELAQEHNAPALRLPINREARLRGGFSEVELVAMQATCTKPDSRMTAR